MFKMVVIWLCFGGALGELVVQSNMETETHHIDKRWVGLIYPTGSIMQFAMALALPAEVRKRTIATNCGIIINMDLPNNASVYYTKPPDVQTRAFHNRFLDVVHSLLNMYGLGHHDCMLKTICVLSKIPPDQETLLVQIMKTLFKEFKKRLDPAENLLGFEKISPDKCKATFKSCPVSLVDVLYSQAPEILFRSF